MDDNDKVICKVHHLTHDPSKAWEELKENQKVIWVQPLPYQTPVYPDKVRFVCISDTYCRDTLPILPKGDVLLHAGDFTQKGLEKEVTEFNRYLGTTPIKYKVVIAGNHELTFDKFRKYVSQKEMTKVRGLLKNCIYLEDSEVEIYGIRIYGSPWTPKFHDWAFNAMRGEQILAKWNCIPEGIDILMTHGPPIGHGDLNINGIRTGCVELLHSIQDRIEPKYHVFGHIHEGYGITTDGKTTFINASICDIHFDPVNPPIIFDIPLPAGYSKDLM